MFVNGMGAVAMASAYLYTVCKTKCIDMNATMCATSRGMSALFGREDGMGGSECGAAELWEWEPLKILLTTVCVTLMVSMCATSHGMSAVYGRLGPQEGGQDGRIRVWSRGVVGVGASLRSLPHLLVRPPPSAQRPRVPSAHPLLNCFLQSLPII